LKGDAHGAVIMVHDPQRNDESASGQGERVAKALARAGVASRRDVEKLIEAGRVAINGRVLTTPAVRVEAGDILTVDGEVVNEAEPARLFRYHKPVGLVTTHKDPQGRPTVFEALPPGLPRLISVGRLDLNSEGLLLLTNDGGLARALEQPDTAIVRRYRVRARGRITQERLDRLKDGVTVEGVRYGAIEAKIDKAKEGPQGANIWISVTLTEGKNREIRRVFLSLGLHVSRLIRLSYGPFALGTLEVGQVEEVGPRVIREQLADHIDPANLPKGDRPQFTTKASAGVTGAGRRDGQRQRPPPSLKARPAAAGAEGAPDRKKAYKAGWAKPKIAAKPHAPPKRKAAAAAKPGPAHIGADKALRAAPSGAKPVAARRAPRAGGPKRRG
jgi:23S rRNA pseudouridine2605 synthase